LFFCTRIEKLLDNCEVAIREFSIAGKYLVNLEMSKDKTITSMEFHNMDDKYDNYLFNNGCNRANN
jgi:hypothetical protein